MENRTGERMHIRDLDLQSKRFFLFTLKNSGRTFFCCCTDMCGSQEEQDRDYLADMYLSRRHSDRERAP